MTNPESVGLPPVVFLYTLDQIAAMINVSLDDFMAQYAYYHQRSKGYQSPKQMMARNIAPAEKPAEWRISQSEFIRWLKFSGFKLRQFKGTAI